MIKAFCQFPQFIRECRVVQKQSAPSEDGHTLRERVSHLYPYTRTRNKSCCGQAFGLLDLFVSSTSHDMRNLTRSRFAHSSLTTFWTAKSTQAFSSPAIAPWSFLRLTHPTVAAVLQKESVPRPDPPSAVRIKRGQIKTFPLICNEAVFSLQFTVVLSVYSFFLTHIDSSPNTAVSSAGSTDI